MDQISAAREAKVRARRRWEMLDIERPKNFQSGGQDKVWMP
jgi:hypothetical protein